MQRKLTAAYAKRSLSPSISAIRARVLKVTISLFRSATRSQCVNREQKGFSLILVLLLLVVVSLVGISAVQISLMGERGSRNERDYQIAWQATEAVLMDAEFDIRGPNTSTNNRMAMFAEDNAINFPAFVATGTDPSCASDASGLCQPSPKGQPPTWLNMALWTAAADSYSAELGAFTGRSFAAGADGIQPIQKPRYIIEILPDTPSGGDASIGAKKKFVYRITAMGFGPRADIQTVAQMLFRKEAL